MAFSVSAKISTMPANKGLPLPLLAQPRLMGLTMLRARMCDRQVRGLKVAVPKTFKEQKCQPARSSGRNGTEKGMLEGWGRGITRKTNDTAGGIGASSDGKNGGWYVADVFLCKQLQESIHYRMAEQP